MQNIAIVTGSIGGIGTAICKHLFRDGKTVVATFREKNKEAAISWQNSLRAEGIVVDIYPVDVSSFDSCQTLIQQVEKDIGTISILVNNAGITDDATMKKITLDQWNNVLRTNLDSVFNMSKVVFQSMCDQNYGRIVNISSINGQKGQFGQVNYSAAKAGIYGFTKSLAQEGAKKGVMVNSISPGYIATEMVVNLPENIIESIVNDIPVGRLGEPEEVANAVSFFVGEHSGFITGSNLSINGGQHMY